MLGKRRHSLESCLTCFIICAFTQTNPIMAIVFINFNEVLWSSLHLRRREFQRHLSMIAVKFVCLLALWQYHKGMKCQDQQRHTNQSEKRDND